MTRRFRAPQGHGERLVVPAFDCVPELAQYNRELLDSATCTIDGTPLGEFRHLARLEIIGIDQPVFATGHQPEQFHPGVWAKNFALNGLARRCGAIPLNVIVDNDTLKAGYRLVPMWNADPAQVRLMKEPFAEFTGEVPWERTALAAQFTAERIATERLWGCQNRELTVSQLSQTSAFQRFASQIRNDLPRFRAAYNRAVAWYRSIHRIENASHPVPDLAEGELPFWEMTTTRRVRATPSTPRERLRPRALTLTLFIRVCLADWFIHGIGGGKYDEVTDDIIREYFGLEAPAFQVVTGTLHLPYPGFPATSTDLKKLEHQLRRLNWNPEEFVPANHPARQEKLALITQKPHEHLALDRWYRRIREITSELRNEVKEQVLEVEQSLARVRSELAANAILRRRDYAWVLHPEANLRPFLQGFLQA